MDLNVSGWNRLINRLLLSGPVQRLTRQPWVLENIMNGWVWVRKDTTTFLASHDHVETPEMLDTPPLRPWTIRRRAWPWVAVIQIVGKLPCYPVFDDHRGRRVMYIGHKFNPGDTVALLIGREPGKIFCVTDERPQPLRYPEVTFLENTRVSELRRRHPRATLI